MSDTLQEPEAPATTNTAIPAPLPSATTVVPVTEEPTAKDHQHVATTSLPPMKGSWRRPRKCNWSYNVDETAAPDNIVWMDYQPIEGASTLSCYPDGMFTHGQTGIFSPGNCPDGWTTASVITGGVTSEKASEQTTTAICCSDNYTLDGSRCVRRHSTIKAVPITYNRTANSYEAVPSTTTTLHGILGAIYTIQALARDVDKEMLGIEDMGISEENGKRGDSLPLSARLGIGIGAAVFAVLLVGAVWLGIRYCRRRQVPGEEDSFPIEISGVQYGVREGYGPKPVSRCTTCETEVLQKENSVLVTIRANGSKGSTARDAKANRLGTEAVGVKSSVQHTS